MSGFLKEYYGSLVPAEPKSYFSHSLAHILGTKVSLLGDCSIPPIRPRFPPPTPFQCSLHRTVRMVMSLCHSKPCPRCPFLRKAHDLPLHPLPCSPGSPHLTTSSSVQDTPPSTAAERIFPQKSCELAFPFLHTLPFQ